MATLHLTLEIESDEEPISGRVTGPRDQQREFHGWTALATTIETALGADDRPRRDTPAGPTHPQLERNTRGLNEC